MLARRNVLDELAVIGAELAHQADPTTWRFEDRSRAEYYRPRLVATRRAWAKIRNGAPMRDALVALRADLDTGVERNKLEKLIAKL